jgi:hypothetical protein
MARGRVQAPEIEGPVALQPPGLPGDTFTGAAQAPINTDLTRLADALSSFNTQLSSFGTASMAAQKKQQAEIEGARANKMIMGMTRDEAIERVQNGTMPNFADPFARAMVEKNAGQAYGERLVQGIQQQIKTGQIDLSAEGPGTNIEDYITKAAQDDMQGMPGTFQSSKAGMSGYQQRVESARDALMKAQLEQRSAAFTRKQEGVAYDQFNKMFEQTAGDSPEVTQQKVRGVYLDLGNNKFLKNDQLDQQLMNVLRNRASDPNSVESVVHALGVDRVGKDGEKIPALGANPRYAADIQQIRDTARATLTKKFDDTMETQAVANVKSAMERQDGSLWTMNNATYKNPYDRANGDRTINVDKVKQSAVNDWLTWSKQLAASRQETPDLQYQREWSVLTANNIANPAWKEMLTGPPKAFANPQALTNPVTRQAAMAAGEKFMEMDSANHPYVKNTLGLDSNTTDFYQVYSAARQQLGKNADEALDMAASAIRTPDNENDLAVRAQRAKDVEAKVKSMDFGSGWTSYMPFVNSDAKNSGALQKRVLDVATLYTRIPGMNLDDAVKAAVDTVQKRSVYINGHVVADTGWLPPPQFKGNIESALEHFHKQYGDANHVSKPTDLSIEPMGGGTFRIIDASQEGGKPLYARDASGRTVPATISMPMLLGLQKQKDAAKADEIQQSQQQNQQSAITAEQDKLRSTPDRLLSPAKRAEKAALAPADPGMTTGPALSPQVVMPRSITEAVPPKAFEDFFQNLLRSHNPRMGKH